MNIIGCEDNVGLSSEGLLFAIEEFLKNGVNKGHVDRADVDEFLNVDYELSKVNGLKLFNELLREFSTPEKLRVLEIGCSWSPIGLSIVDSGYVEEFLGIEPEDQAVNLGNLIAENLGWAEKFRIVKGFAESLPFADNYFDLVVCRTVLEHVDSVKDAIKEMVRVVKYKDGIIYMDAPNYVFPYEPHLKIWSFPHSPKWLFRFLGRLARKDVSFLGHLKLIKSYSVKRYFRDSEALVDDLSEKKLFDSVVNLDFSAIIAYSNSLRLLTYLPRFFRRFIFLLLKTFHFYPSMIFLVRKK